MKPEKELEDMARSICEEHAARRIRAEILVEPGSARTKWDSFQLRHVFEQPFTIWRRAAAFDVILDAAGRMVGFVDHDKYVGSNEGSLTPEEAQAIVAALDVLPKGARLIDLKAARIRPDIRVCQARYELAFPLPEYEAVDVEINPTRREVIAVRPVPRRR